MTLANQPPIQELACVEGITEYRLDNGTQVLLIPDESKSMVTVNMTVFVGSRHEGYGEAGMAHLLEHMLFKGTPDHPKIPDLLNHRGADYNGTTWLDRTNYFETLPATTAAQASESLEFALRLEADRLVNSHVSGEDLALEMTVVRNEFERGENSPRRILMQRIQSAAYDWHNYGRSTIGNLSDIERVPVDRLKEFYRKFYRPDNVMVVIAGKFDTGQALSLVDQYFGAIATPDEPLDTTYTTEPAQDGERQVVLRRVGNTQLIQVAYHIPSGANRQFAAIELLAYIFGAEPSGRMYRELVVPEVVSNVNSMPMALHDPGLMLFGCQLPADADIDRASDALLSTIENVASQPITEEELKRARIQFLKDRELRASDTKSIAVELSEWAAQGDWRLYFLFRDTIENVTADECTAAATQYFCRNNRTLGLFIPSEASDRVEIPSQPDLQELLAGYQGREDLAQGEDFDPDPNHIEERTCRGSLSCGLQTAWLPKKTRGKTVNLEINLRYGNEQSLSPFYGAALDFLPEMMMRGTRNLGYQELQDRLDELRAQVRISGAPGLLNMSVETKRDSLDELLPVLAEILRQPRFAQEELDVIRRQAISSTETRMTEPSALAGLALRRALAPFAPGDARYVPTHQERLVDYREISVEQIRELHTTQLSAEHGEVTAVGDFDPVSLEQSLESLFSDWTSDHAHQRIAYSAQVEVPGGEELIATPDKANAVYYGGEHLKMRDDHADYAALLVGIYIFGGSALSSRIGDRVRQQEGLSYGVGAGINAHPVDERASLTLYAIFSPENKDRLLTIVEEELTRLLKDGISNEELTSAKQGILQGNQLDRTQDDNLASLLAATFFAKRDMRFYSDFEAQIQNLETHTVDEAMRKHIAPQRLITVVAGDFK